MDFGMKVPCPDCPFRKEGGIPLRAARIRQIASMMLDSQGGTFPCHRTVDYEASSMDDQGENHISGDGELHCAGALIFAEKNDASTQMMRIMERVGGYDRRVFTDESKAFVWDNMRQWLKHASARVPRKAKS